MLVVIAPPSCLILLFGSSLFVSWWVWLKVHQYCISLKRTNSWFHSPFVCAFSLYVIYFQSNLFYFLSSNYSGIYFSSSFRCGARLFMWDFFASLGRPVMLWTSFSGLYSVSHILHWCVHIFISFQVVFDFFIDLIGNLQSYSLFNIMLFSLQVSECFFFIYHSFFFVSCHCDPRRCLVWFQSS